MKFKIIKKKSPKIFSANIKNVIKKIFRIWIKSTEKKKKINTTNKNRK